MLLLSLLPPLLLLLLLLSTLLPVPRPLAAPPSDPCAVWRADALDGARLLLNVSLSTSAPPVEFEAVAWARGWAP